MAICIAKHDLPTFGSATKQYSPFAINYKAQNCTGKMLIHTSISKVQDMYIPLPPLKEQEKIVENKMKQSILNSIFSVFQIIQ